MIIGYTAKNEIAQALVLAKAAIILESLEADGTVTTAIAAIEEIMKAQRNLRWKIREERLAKSRENGVQLKIFQFMRADS